MMLAFGHAASGWCTALMIINWLNLFIQFSWAAVLLLSAGTALAFAGAAILPDIDYRNSTISTAFGPLSYQLHLGVIELHYVVAGLTRQGTNRKPPGPHRGVTHWYPAPPITGALVALGCYWSKWFLFGALVVLYTGALRALTVPDYMPTPNHSVRKRWSMQATHGILDLTPGALITLGVVGILGTILVSKWILIACILLAICVIPIHLLKQTRRHVTRTHTVHITYWWKFNIPVGKLGTILVATVLALTAIHYPFVVSHGMWLGAIVCLGMYLHIVGDGPTEMGIPGRSLYSFWRLPKWLAFRAGGPFEILALWVPMSVLGLYLIPGVRPHAEVMTVQSYILWALSTLTVLAIVIEAVSRHAKRKVWS